MPVSSVSIVSRCTVFSQQRQIDAKSTTPFTLPLSASDLPMLTCQYIQKGCLYSVPSNDVVSIPRIISSLSHTLSHFPALAGRLHTEPTTGHVSIQCNNSGVLFLHARAPRLLLSHLLLPNSDVPVHFFRQFFAFDNTLSYDGHNLPLAAVQVTELGDGVFIGFTVNHAIVDGTSYWNFFNTFAEICRGVNKISRPPEFSRATVFSTGAVLKFTGGRPAVTFSGDAPVRERIFHFSRGAILELKKRANSNGNGNGVMECTELMWKESNDMLKLVNGKLMIKGKKKDNRTAEISSFQSLCAQLWKSVTRARNLDKSKTTTFRMAVNCRHRVDPKMDPLYFGNAIQSIPTTALAGDVVSEDLRWCANLLHHNVINHVDQTVKKGVKDWEADPRCFPLGNFDGAMITMGSSPRFPMYDNDFGWGRPIAIRSGRANKFDGKISAFPGREGDGSVDLEVVLAPETMANIEKDVEFMQYVSD